jgi:2-dehydrotetronate isomerase
MPRFAANLTMMFTERPFLERPSAAAAAGFSAVEFLFPFDHTPDEVARALAQAGVELVLFNAPPGDWAAGERGLACLPERRDEMRAGIARAIVYARATGCPRVHLVAGLGKPADALAARAYRDAVAYAADALGEAGLDLLIEPINPRSIPGFFLRSFPQAVAVIEALARSNLKLQFDIFHRQILHGDVIHGLRALAPLIGHVQTAAVPDRHEPGTGELDDARIFAALDEIGYAGWVGCEYHPRAGTEAGLGWMTPYRKG